MNFVVSQVWGCTCHPSVWLSAKHLRESQLWELAKMTAKINLPKKLGNCLMQPPPPQGKSSLESGTTKVNWLPSPVYRVQHENALQRFILGCLVLLATSSLFLLFCNTFVFPIPCSKTKTWTGTAKAPVTSRKTSTPHACTESKGAHENCFVQGSVEPVLPPPPKNYTRHHWSLENLGKAVSNIRSVLHDVEVRMKSFCSLFCK